MRRALFLMASALALACPSLVRADPLTVEIALGLESYGRVAIDPTGAIAVFEERLSRIDLPRHDVEAEGANRYARLYRLDLDDTAPPRPLLPMADNAGYTAGPFSPDGSRMVVFRLRDDAWRLGVVVLATGRVVWTEVAPDLGLWGRSVEWLGNDSLIVLGTPDGSLPARLAGPRTEQARLLALRAAAMEGAAAAVMVGSDAKDTLAPRRLWRITATTGRASAIADGPFLDFESSPDGRHVALLLDGPLLPPPAAEASTEVRRARGLQIVSLEDRRLISPPGTGDISTSLLAWSPRSDALLVVAIDGDRTRLLTVGTDGQVQDQTPSGVTPVAATDFQGMPTAEDGWLDGAPVFKGRSEAGEGWFSLDGGIQPISGLGPNARLVAEHPSVVLFNHGGNLVRLDSDGQVTVLGPAGSAVDPGGPFGLRALNGPMKRRFATLSQLGGRLCRVYADPALETACAIAAPGAAVSWSHGVSIDRSGQEDEPDVLRRQDEHGRTVVRRINPELDRIEVAAPRRVSAPGGVGGWLYLPRDLSSKPPVIVVPYQGDAYDAPPWWMRRESTSLSMAPQLLVAEGYAILIPDLPPTREPADGLAARILAVVDAAGAEGLVDGERVGVWGWSFGAWSAVMGAAQSDRFDAVVALNGPMNFSTVIGDVGSTLRLEGGHPLAASASARWLESGQAAMRTSYWCAADRYRRNSPFDQADRIHTPTLLVAGEYDLMLGQSEQLYGALHRLGRPVALTLLIGEEHGLRSPGNIRLYYQQVRAWFDRYLKPSGGPADLATAEPKPPSAPD
ncbi:MAG TPA: hypothetical protein DCG66_11485 [Brevundimonas sp.]|nr:hypothetical protein [Brevundimonas sp.]